MNDKRFTLKFLGIFLMDALNYQGREIRRTFWHLVGGICLIIAVYKGFGLLEVLLR
jgi:hypothetical protein